MTGDGSQEFKMIRVRKSTYDALSRVLAKVKARGTLALPAGVRMEVDSYSDAIDLAIRALEKVLG